MDKKVFSRGLLLHSSFVVEALKKVGKEDWDFSKDPCSGEGNWSVLDLSKGFEGFFTAYTDFKPPQSSGNRNVVAIVTGTAAGAVFVALLVLGAMQRNGWLGGKVSADKVVIWLLSMQCVATKLTKKMFIALEVYVLQERGRLSELVDPELGSDYSSEEAMLISLYDVEHRVKAAKRKGVNDSGRTKWN
ncbi:hypothetical protein NC652_040448 [Populus alba x Populus x berolinensis]|nr:hypothetical protein NC652_040448 [Populus alba x Populus x berolinensis]